MLSQMGWESHKESLSLPLQRDWSRPGHFKAFIWGLLSSSWIAPSWKCQWIKALFQNGSSMKSFAILRIIALQPYPIMLSLCLWNTGKDGDIAILKGWKRLGTFAAEGGEWLNILPLQRTPFLFHSIFPNLYEKKASPCELEKTQMLLMPS